MADYLAPVKALVPKPIKRKLRNLHRERTFKKALEKFGTETAVGSVSRATLEELVYGWGNAGWSVQYEYMEALVKYAAATKGPILECGSGLSTVMMSVMLGSERNRIWSLEHTPLWAERLQGVLKQHGIDGANIVLTTLDDCGEYDWYQTENARIPEGLSLVLCDGPPNSTRGQRYGLLPQMKSRLAEGCVVLVDDMERPEERAMVERWQSEFGGEIEIHGEDKPFAVYRV